MEGHSFGKLIELVLIVGGLYWFWSSQMAAVRKEAPKEKGDESGAAPESGTKERLPPRT